MDREKALSILGLRDNATNDDIAKRYTVKLKIFRNSDKDEKGNTIENVEEAYRFLLGLDYYDAAAEREKLKRLENPNPIYKFLKVDEEKASNFFYYYKWKIIIAITAIAVFASLALSSVNREKPDFQILFAGKIVVMEYNSLENAIKEELGIKTVDVKVITLTENADYQMHVALEQKLAIELMQGQNDIFIMDYETYVSLASMGAFTPLNDKLDQFGIKSYDKEKLEVALKLEDGKEYEPLLYGVDVSNSPMLRDYDVAGDVLIASFNSRGANPENGQIYFKKLVESVQ